MGAGDVLPPNILFTIGFLKNSSKLTTKSNYVCVFIGQIYVLFVRNVT